MDDRPEHHGGKAHGNIEQQQQEHTPGFQQFPCRHAGPKDPIQIPVTDASCQQGKHRGSPVRIQGDRQDVLHALVVLQGPVPGVKPDHRRRQPEIHNAKIGDEGPHQLIQAVSRFPDIVQEKGDVEETDDGMERNIQITEQDTEFTFVHNIRSEIGKGAGGNRLPSILQIKSYRRLKEQIPRADSTGFLLLRGTNSKKSFFPYYNKMGESSTVFCVLSTRTSGRQGGSHAAGEQKGTKKDTRGNISLGILPDKSIAPTAW